MQQRLFLAAALPLLSIGCVTLWDEMQQAPYRAERAREVASKVCRPLFACPESVEGSGVEWEPAPDDEVYACWDWARVEYERGVWRCSETSRPNRAPCEQNVIEVLHARVAEWIDGGGRGPWWDPKPW